MSAKFKKLITIVGFFVCAISSTLAQAELVINGGFEAGDFTGWTQFGLTDFTAVDEGFPHGGDYSAYMGSIGGTGTLSQDLATVAGQQYLVKFWLLNGDGANPDLDLYNYFSWSWDGVMGSPEFENSGMDNDFFEYVATLTATDDSTTLSFVFRNDSSFWVFDDVSVTEVGGNNGGNDVPEPGTLLLLGAALAAAGLMRRKH